jgi:serine/threonine-protein kinase
MDAKPNPLLPISRFVLELPPGDGLPNTAVSPFVISNDGRTIVFNGEDSAGIRRLYVRTLEEVQALPVRGTDGASTNSLYLSPDGQSIVFPADGAIKKVSVNGGNPTTLVKIEDPIMGLTWGADESIVFGVFKLGHPLMRVSVEGGNPEPLSQPSQDEIHGHPQFIADGRTLLFDVARQDNDLAFDQIAILSLETGEQRFLTEGAFPMVTSNGLLVYARDDSIWAAQLDPNVPEVASPTPVLDDALITPFGTRLSIAGDGSMVYQPGGVRQSNTLAWIDQDGNEVQLSTTPDFYAQTRLSPDGTRLAVRTIRGDVDARLWVHSLERGTFTKLTEIDTHAVVWSPDGQHIVYTPQDGSINLYRINSDGTGAAERLTESPRAQYASSWSQVAGEILYSECDGVLVACDLGRLILGDQIESELILSTPANECHAALSPDGRWVAYESDRSGRSEIYIRPYPDTDTGLLQISVDGGWQPLWSPNGKTLYYTAGSNLNRTMMSVSISVEQEFSMGEPRAHFDFTHAPYAVMRSHDLHPDGNRFLMVKAAEQTQKPRHLIYVDNWLASIEPLVARGR